MNGATRALGLSLLALLLAGCPKRIPPPQVAPHRSYPLLEQTPEAPTEQRTQKRDDLEVDNHLADRTPRVIATGESPLLTLGGAHATLAGDAEGTQGWSVDNFVLFEVLDAHDHVTDRFVVGFTSGVTRGHQRLDNVGRMSFSFAPREVDISSHLPAHGPFKLRATALDAGGVGQVSRVFLLLDRGSQSSASDDLRDD